MKIKDLIKELEKLDGEKTIGILDCEEGIINYSLNIFRNNYAKSKSDNLKQSSDYLIE